MRKLKGYRKEQKGKIFTKNLPDLVCHLSHLRLSPCPRLLAVPDPVPSTHRSPLSTQHERFFNPYATMLSLTMWHDSVLLFWWVEACGHNSMCSLPQSSPTPLFCKRVMLIAPIDIRNSWMVSWVSKVSELHDSSLSKHWEVPSLVFIFALRSE